MDISQNEVEHVSLLVKKIDLGETLSDEETNQLLNFINKGVDSFNDELDIALIKEKLAGNSQNN